MFAGHPPGDLKSALFESRSFLFVGFVPDVPVPGCLQGCHIPNSIDTAIDLLIGKGGPALIGVFRQDMLDGILVAGVIKSLICNVTSDFEEYIVHHLAVTGRCGADLFFREGAAELFVRRINQPQGADDVGYVGQLLLCNFFRDGVVDALLFVL